MYAIIQTGGKQYRVGEGDLLRVEKVAGEPGGQVAFDNVLLVGDSEDAAVGNPTVEGARVLATVVRQGRGDKILVFKFKRRKMYRRKNGHRQSFTEVRIDRLETAGRAKAADSEKAKSPKKAAAQAETIKTPATEPKADEAKKTAAKAEPKKAPEAEKKTKAKAQPKKEPEAAQKEKKTAAGAEAKKTAAKAEPKKSAGKAEAEADEKPEPPASDGE